VFLADLDRFMQRKMSLFFLYTGENQNVYNYADQLYDVCPALREYPLQSLHYVPRCDHTFTHEEMRSQLIAALEHWLKTQVLDREPRRIRESEVDRGAESAGSFQHFAPLPGRMYLR
jgi:hypothetical protein